MIGVIFPVLKFLRAYSGSENSDLKIQKAFFLFELCAVPFFRLYYVQRVKGELIRPKFLNFSG